MNVKKIFIVFVLQFIGMNAIFSFPGPKFACKKISNKTMLNVVKHWVLNKASVQIVKEMADLNQQESVIISSFIAFFNGVDVFCKVALKANKCDSRTKFLGKHFVQFLTTIMFVNANWWKFDDGKPAFARLFLRSFLLNYFLRFAVNYVTKEDETRDEKDEEAQSEESLTKTESSDTVS